MPRPAGAERGTVDVCGQAGTGGAEEAAEGLGHLGRSGAPDSIMSTAVSDVWMWPRAGMCVTGTPAAPSASA